MSTHRSRAGSHRHVDGQAGYTLVELIIALAISVFVATALTSVVFSSAKASNIAIGRIEASSQIRSFEMRAYDDFASSSLPALGGGCGDQASDPCTTTPIVLDLQQASNSASPTISPVQVTYVWDGSANLDRQVAGNATHLGTSVTAFSWYEDSSTNSVVVQVTVTVLSYSETQTFTFYPRVSQ